MYTKTIKLDLVDFNTIAKWLLSHEQDIAMGVKDYSDLRELFVAIHNRHPMETNA